MLLPAARSSIKWSWLALTTRQVLGAAPRLKAAGLKDGGQAAPLWAAADAGLPDSLPLCVCIVGRRQRPAHVPVPGHQAGGGRACGAQGARRFCAVHCYAALMCVVPHNCTSGYHA